LRSNSADQTWNRAERPRSSSSVRSMGQKRAARSRMPSTMGYMAAAGLTATALFFVLLGMLHSTGEDAAWVPAGLAASVVMMVAIAAREVVMRRAWTRYILDQDQRRDRSGREAGKRSGSSSNSGSGAATVAELHSSAWRALQRKSSEADTAGSLPEAHFEAYQLCKEYLASAEEALRTASLTTEKRAALRSGQEKARALHKHHLLRWSREASRLLTDTAQRQVLVSQRIETAMRALSLIESALKVYPEEPQLRASAVAVQEFIGSIKVAHWIELAERAAFKGHHVRAINRYRDALFYLSRETVGDEMRTETAERITREIEFLRARLDIQDSNVDASLGRAPRSRRKRERQ
jgi:heme exporter protein D